MEIYEKNEREREREKKKAFLGNSEEDRNVLPIISAKRLRSMIQVKKKLMHQ